MRVTPTLGNSNRPMELPEDCSKTINAAQRCLGQKLKAEGSLKEHRFSTTFPETAASRLLR